MSQSDGKQATVGFKSESLDWLATSFTGCHTVFKRRQLNLLLARRAYRSESSSRKRFACVTTRPEDRAERGNTVTEFAQQSCEKENIKLLST
jgi:hypothetical protein